MTTSIVDGDEILKQLSGEKCIPSVVSSEKFGPESPVSLKDLFDRARELFTPEEAEALARRIEEGREQAYD